MEEKIHVLRIYNWMWLKLISLLQKVEYKAELERWEPIILENCRGVGMREPKEHEMDAVGSYTWYSMKVVEGRVKEHDWEWWCLPCGHLKVKERCDTRQSNSTTL
jgi:hypothetical protein